MVSSAGGEQRNGRSPVASPDLVRVVQGAQNYPGTRDVDFGTSLTIHQHRGEMPVISQGPSSQMSGPDTMHDESVLAVQTLYEPPSPPNSTIIWPHL